MVHFVALRLRTVRSWSLLRLKTSNQISIVDLRPRTEWLVTSVVLPALLPDYVFLVSFPRVYGFRRTGEAAVDLTQRFGTVSVDPTQGRAARGARRACRGGMERPHAPERVHLRQCLLE